MNKKMWVVGLAALLAAPVAFAADMPKGSIAGHITMLDADFDDGIGPGIRGWGRVGQAGFIHGEYSMVGLEIQTGLGTFDVDVNELRLGGGLTGDIQADMMWMAKAEYIDLGSDLDSDGFGIHGGLMFQAAPAIHVFGSVGLLDLGDDDGLELNFGGSYAISRDLAAIVDYRTFSGDFVDVTELRFALGYMFY